MNSNINQGVKSKVIKKNILYIHGFNSSPLSDKAQQTQLYFSKHFPQINFYCPQLPTTPKQAVIELEQLIERQTSTKELPVNGEQNEIQQQWYLIGSSLGGYFSTYLSQKYNLSAVLINPSVKPYELLEDFIGEQVNPYTREVYQIESKHMTDLIMLEQHKIEKNNYLVMVQTGDEVLDYQQAVEKYKNCQLIVQEGGDHSFIDYHTLLPDIAEFFNFCP